MCCVSLVHAQQYPEIRSPVPIHTESHFMSPFHWVLFIGASFCHLHSRPAFSALWTSNLRNKLLSRTGLDNLIPLILLLPRSAWWDHVILHSHVPPSLCTLPEFRDSLTCPQLEEQPATCSAPVQPRWCHKNLLWKRKKEVIFCGGSPRRDQASSIPLCSPRAPLLVFFSRWRTHSLGTQTPSTPASDLHLETLLSQDPQVFFSFPSRP